MVINEFWPEIFVTETVSDAVVITAIICYKLFLKPQLNNISFLDTRIRKILNISSGFLPRSFLATVLYSERCIRCKVLVSLFGKT